MITETRFTPGPWYADCDGATGKATRVRASAKGGRDQFCIADCERGAGAFDTLEANALLIAAAPELHAALRNLAAQAGGLRAFDDEIRAVIGNTNWRCIDAAITLADAALAKARGESTPC